MPSPTVVTLLSDKRSGSTLFRADWASHPDALGLDVASHAGRAGRHWLTAGGMDRIPGSAFAKQASRSGYGRAPTAWTDRGDRIFGHRPDVVSPGDSDAANRVSCRRQGVAKGTDPVRDRVPRPMPMQCVQAHPYRQDS